MSYMSSLSGAAFTHTPLPVMDSLFYTLQHFSHIIGTDYSNPHSFIDIKIQLYAKYSDFDSSVRVLVLPVSVHKREVSAHAWCSSWFAVVHQMISVCHLQAAGVLNFKMHVKPVNVSHYHFGWSPARCALHNPSIS